MSCDHHGRRFTPIEDYALVGDGRTVALVSEEGSVDWWPVPTLDGPPVCAALLDPEAGGRFVLAPAEPGTTSRHYLPGTNVVETTYTTPAGTARVTECLNTGDAGRLPWTELARRVDGVTGNVPMRWELAPGTRFGDCDPALAVRGGVPVATIGDQSVGLIVHGADPGRLAGGAVAGTFEVRPGERVVVAAVATDREPLYVPRGHDIDSRIDRTLTGWRSWTEAIEYGGPWREQVVRSALALKALLFEPGGAFAAAATTSLPERIGGDKNWDYRFSWVRDSSFAVDALINLGLDEDVHAAVSWLFGAIRRSSPDLKVFYTLAGRVAGGDDAGEGERVLDAPGYRDSRPVRSGNRAGSQVQLGIYGDLFDAVLRYVEAGHLLDPGSSRLLGDIADRCCDRWTERDSGIWELPELEHYTISKIGCWTALDRAVRLAEAGQLPLERAERWRKEAGAVRAWVNEHCWSQSRGCYTMAAGSEDLDSGVLLAGRTGFDRGPRLGATIDAIAASLSVPSTPLLFRYSGMQSEEGAFVACTFWMVDALAQTGQVERARDMMDSAVGLANGVGLFAEQIDPRTGSFLGNFPQGLSHLALVNAAHAIDRAGRAAQRSSPASMRPER